MTAAQAVDRPPRRGTSVFRIIGEVWKSRDLVTEFVIRDLRIRYTQAIMGFGWALIVPLLIVGAGLVFRFVLATITGEQLSREAVAALTVKAIPWAFFSGALTVATQSILSHANLIGKIHFVRESLPIAAVLAQVVDSGLAVIAATVMLVLLGVGFTIEALWALPVTILLVLFVIGCALILSCSNLFFRDVKYITQVALSFGVFATPVFFEPAMLGPRGAKIMLMLPLSPFIQALDLSLARGHNLARTLIVETPAGPATVWHPMLLCYSAILAILTLFVGLKVFRKASTRFAEVA